MTQKNKTGRFHRLSAWAMTVCMTAVFAVFTLSSTAGAASAQNADAALQRFGVRGNVACSTYGNNPNGFMANVNGKVYILDLKNNRIASIENPEAVFKDLDKENSKKKGLFITQFLIHNDSYDKDHQFGEWRGSHHLISSVVKAPHPVIITEISRNRKTSIWLPFS